MNALLTPIEVATILKRPLSSVYELVRRRKIAAIKEGRRIRFRQEDVERYLCEHLVEPLSALPDPSHGARSRLRRTPGRNGEVL